MGPLLATRYVFTITAHVAGIVSVGDIGTGERRIVPIVGGEVRGRDISGKVCAFGADFQIVRPDSSIELEAKYAVETDDGAVIYVENRGIRRPSHRSCRDRRASGVVSHVLSYPSPLRGGESRKAIGLFRLHSLTPPPDRRFATATLPTRSAGEG